MGGVFVCLSCLTFSLLFFRRGVWLRVFSLVLFVLVGAVVCAYNIAIYLSIYLSLREIKVAVCFFVWLIRLHIYNTEEGWLGGGW